MRLHQAVDFKQSEYGGGQGNEDARNFDRKSVNSRANDFDDQQSLFNNGSVGRYFHYEGSRNGDESQMGGYKNGGSVLSRNHDMS